MQRARVPAALALRSALAMAVTLLVAGCSDDEYDDGTGPQACTPGAAQVCMTATTFNPATVTVTAGTTVQWLNTSGLTHTVTSVGGSSEIFDQSVASGSGGFSRQFNTAGTYHYYCTIHGTPTSGMRGTLVVN